MKLPLVCPHCGASSGVYQLIETLQYYNAVFELCKTMTEDENLEWDMAFIGDIADYAAETLCNIGKRVRFPAIVTNEDGTQYAEEYYYEGEIK